MQKTIQKTCIQCSEHIRGRIDKKFCSDECRTAFHNVMHRNTSKFMVNINNILRKNRRILAEINTRGKTKVTRAQLLDEGFRFSYHTNEFQTRSGKTYYFCYEQGYLELETGIYALVVKHEYVD